MTRNTLILKTFFVFLIHPTITHPYQELLLLLRLPNMNLSKDMALKVKKLTFIVYDNKKNYTCLEILTT
jgi:hypothetical protein